MPSYRQASGLSRFLLVAQCFRHGSLFCPSSSFIYSVPFHPLHPRCYLHWNYNIEKENNIISIQENVEHQGLRNPIPLYDFYAAAGTFSEMQSEKDFTLIEGPENIRPNNEYFACKIIGDSMNRVIPNGSICLFKKDSGGSRNGKIVLIENRDVQDQDFNSAFTIKTYSSEKIISEETWGHESIVLRPNSFDAAYKNIIISKENDLEMRIVGEFVKVLTNL